MYEYIEKETMRRIIKEQERIHGIRGAGWIELAMDKEKSVDAVPVVRCGECKHSFVGPCLSCQAGKSVMCGKFHTHMMVKDFCKYGERRKENAVHAGKSD